MRSTMSAGSPIPVRSTTPSSTTAPIRDGPLPVDNVTSFIVTPFAYPAVGRPAPADSARYGPGACLEDRGCRSHPRRRFRTPCAWPVSPLIRGICIIVRLHTDEGLSGIAERRCSLLLGRDPRVGGAPCAGAVRSVLLGADPFDIHAVGHELDRVAHGNSATCSAVDIALHDLVGRIAGAELAMNLRHCLNDGLMVVVVVVVVVVVFFVVGLEVRRELSVGELTDRRRVIVPGIAALGGLVVPAALYLALNPSGEVASGWGVVIGTDTAFLLGALALVGPACPTQLRVFLLTLTIADDVIAVSVIGGVYSESLGGVALVVAGGCPVVLSLLGRWGCLAQLRALGIVLCSQRSGPDCTPPSPGWPQDC
ncbi:MAG: hypothetical protein GEU81_10340 [Nitriliruptorales bacterium]|nr:hypothetical protein [Nitriliruptorales bacterium]